MGRLSASTSAWKGFGTPGGGGSFGFADPDAGIGFAYVMNRAGFRLWDDPREVALRDALYRKVLHEAPQRPDRTGSGKAAQCSIPEALGSIM